MWPKTHFTALFKAQVISDGALWHERDAGRAAAARDSPRAYGACWARDAADYSDVVRVSIDDTAKRCNQSYISIMANLDHQRAIAVTQGRDKGALGRL